MSFESLVDKNNEPIVTRFNISYIPSATVYTVLRQTVKPSDGTGDWLGIGYSGIAQNFPPLEAFEDELYNIESIEASPVVFIEDDATEDRLTDLSNVDVLHIAAHGFFDGGNALSSFLALAPGDDSDGLLQVREIYGLSLKERNPLITLSACELAVNDVSKGDELEGMTRAFLLAGARGVIASLWPVDDYATADLMVEFYQFRAEGMNNAEALAEAKRVMRDVYGDASYWAGFVLVGLEN